jgi:hypothetical protein
MVEPAKKVVGLHRPDALSISGMGEKQERVRHQ